MWPALRARALFTRDRAADGNSEIDNPGNTAGEGTTTPEFLEDQTGEEFSANWNALWCRSVWFRLPRRKVMVDPRETKVVHQMVKLWQSGKSCRAIAKLLNDQKVSTRLGKRWSHSVVKTIIRRHLEQKS